MSTYENTIIEEDFYEYFDGTAEEAEAMDLEEKWEWLQLAYWRDKEYGRM